MIYPVVYSNEATETFEALKQQLHNRWGVEYVLEFEERTMEVVERIQLTPFIYQATETDKNVRKAIIHKNCSMFYQIRDNWIDILFFLDNRQEPWFI